MRLCRLADLDDPGSAGFAVEREGERVPVLIVRRGKDVFAYVNSCPHIGTPLDFQPGRFLDLERRHILCATHGALFAIEDGRCLAGPCAGKALTPLPVRLLDGWVIID